MEVIMSKNKKNYLKKDIIKQGEPFKKIAKLAPDNGEIIYTKETPNFPMMENSDKLVSGSHICFLNPENNHYDYWEFGVPLKKEFFVLQKTIYIKPSH